MLAALLLIAASTEQRFTAELKNGGILSGVTIVPAMKDYPKDARRAGAEGRSVFELTIAPNGKLLGCRIIQTAGHPALDQRACDLYRKRGGFHVSGRVAPVAVQASVRWVLADREPSPAPPSKNY